MPTVIVEIVRAHFTPLNVRITSLDCAGNALNARREVIPPARSLLGATHPEQRAPPPRDGPPEDSPECLFSCRPGVVFDVRATFRKRRLKTRRASDSEPLQSTRRPSERRNPLSDKQRRPYHDAVQFPESPTGARHTQARNSALTCFRKKKKKCNGKNE